MKSEHYLFWLQDWTAAMPEHKNPVHILTIHLRKLSLHVQVCETGLTDFHIPLSLFQAMFQNTNHVKGQLKKSLIWRETGANCTVYPVGVLIPFSTVKRHPFRKERSEY
jgi:hypothetical protein